MPRASELKKGEVVDIGGSPHIVKSLEAKSPSSRGASTLYKIRFSNLLTGQKRDESLKGDEILTSADCQKVLLQFSYIDGDQYVFMDSEDYSQYSLPSEKLEDYLGYIHEGLGGISGLLVQGELAAIDLPQSVVLKIIDTTPAIKGASANTRTKPARLETDLVVQVPEYIGAGEVIKVNTANGRFMGRSG